MTEHSRQKTILAAQGIERMPARAPVVLEPLVATPRSRSTWTFATINGQTPSIQGVGSSPRMTPARFFDVGGRVHNLVPQEFGTA